jgi:hypothetical protein
MTENLVALLRESREHLPRPLSLRSTRERCLSVRVRGGSRRAHTPRRARRAGLPPVLDESARPAASAAPARPGVFASRLRVRGAALAGGCRERLAQL